MNIVDLREPHESRESRDITRALTRRKQRGYRSALTCLRADKPSDYRVGCVTAKYDAIESGQVWRGRSGNEICKLSKDVHDATLSIAGAVDKVVSFIMFANARHEPRLAL